MYIPLDPMNLVWGFIIIGIIHYLFLEPGEGLRRFYKAVWSFLWGVIKIAFIIGIFIGIGYLFSS